MCRARLLPLLASMFLLTVPAACARTAQSAAQGSVPEQDIEGLYQQFLNAITRRDTAAVRRLATPSYTFVASGMDSVVTLAQRLTQIAQPDTALQLVSLRAHDCRVDSYREAIVANCYISQTGRLRGERSRTEALATIV